MSHPLKLCTVKELKSIYGIPVCRQHIWRWIRAGLFPHPVRLGQARIAFRCDQVEAWIARKIETSPHQGELPL